MNSKFPHTIVVMGTNPASKSGGIAFALPGYFVAVESAGIPYHFICTHDALEKHGKWLPWMKSFYLLFAVIWRIRKACNKPVLYCHVGGGFASLVRQSCIAFFARVLGVKSIMQLHGREVDDYLDHWIKNRFFRIAIAPASKIAVLTSWWQTRLLTAGIGKDISVISNPLPADWERVAHISRQATKQSDRINILCVTRLEQGKGVDDLINALALLPDTFRLIIAGAGSQLGDLQGMAGRLQLDDRVSFVGWVTGKNKQKLFDDCDIFCLPSRYDSFGMGYLEAMANGLPVVAFDWGPISDVVADERCGYLAKEYTAIALAEAINKLSDVDLRSAMSSEGKKWVVEQFSSSSIGIKIQKMLCSLGDHA